MLQDFLGVQKKSYALPTLFCSLISEKKYITMLKYGVSLWSAMLAGLPPSSFLSPALLAGVAEQGEKKS